MIYLDNSATTPIDPEVYEAMIPYLTTEYGNPSSKYYELALHAKTAVEESRYWVARLIHAKPEEIIFTCGATESTNLIIKGVADFQKYYAKKGNHIITSKVEHKATLNTCKFLNGEIYSNHDATFALGRDNPKIDRGFEVTFLDVNRFGQVEEGTIEAAIKDSTTLASIMWGNNEIGTLNDVRMLCNICHEQNVLFHSDATQVLGKIDLNVDEIPVDFLSFSAHKIYGPKGIGAAYVRSDGYGLPPITSLIHGGEQENGVRGGTLAVHDIVGFGKSAEIAIRDWEKDQQLILELEKQLLEKLSGLDPSIHILEIGDQKIPGIVSLYIDKPIFSNERFIKRLAEDYNIAVSAGAACNISDPSKVLLEMGKGEFTQKFLRVTLSKYNCLDDIEKLISALQQN